MADKTHDPEKLIQIACRLDELNKLESTSGSIQDLSEDEQSQLVRIQGALRFLNDVRVNNDEVPPNLLEQDALETIRSDGEKTFPGSHSTADGATFTGKQIDRFRLIRLLGKGGFAQGLVGSRPSAGSSGCNQDFEPQPLLVR